MNDIAQEGPKMNHRNSLSLRWGAAREDLRARRGARASERTLARELAGYTTPAQKDELDAILLRADPHAAAEIRFIIRRSRVA